jgi:hypothetical protein
VPDLPWEFKHYRTKGMEYDENIPRCTYFFNFSSAVFTFIKKVTIYKSGKTCTNMKDCW